MSRRRTFTLGAAVFAAVFSILMVSSAFARSLTLPETIKNTWSLTAFSEALRNADEGEKITLYIQGYGGAATATMRLMTDIKMTKADLTCVVNGPVYSAHSLIALSCNKLIVSPYSFFMVHGVQGGGPGQHTSAYNELQRSLLERVLTTREINELFADSEKAIYLSGTEVVKRLNKR